MREAMEQLSWKNAHTSDFRDEPVVVPTTTGHCETYGPLRWPSRPLDKLLCCASRWHEKGFAVLSAFMNI